MAGGFFKFILFIIVVVALVWTVVVAIPHVVDVVSTLSYSEGDVVQLNIDSKCWQYPGGEIKNRIERFYAPYQRVVVKVEDSAFGVVTGNPESLNNFRAGTFLRVVVGGTPCWIDVDDVKVADNK